MFGVDFKRGEIERAPSDFLKTHRGIRGEQEPGGFYIARARTETNHKTKGQDDRIGGSVHCMYGGVWPVKYSIVRCDQGR